MSHTIESLSGCSKKIVFNFETMDLGKEIEEALKERRKTTNLKGFRKGKAPMEMIEKLYRGQIESEALNKFIQNEFFEVITKEKLRVVGQPSFENMKYVAGESMSFDAMIEIFPEIELKEMGHLEFKQDNAEVTEDEIENVKNSYLNSKAELVEINDDQVCLEKGHSAVMNFQGVQESGERPENMKGEEFVLEIGSGQFIPGFEEGMMGMKKGEKKNIDLNFPQEYHAPEL